MDKEFLSLIHLLFSLLPLFPSLYFINRTSNKYSDPSERASATTIVFLIAVGLTGSYELLLLGLFTAIGGS